jgi:hypothetical protein
MFAAPEDSDPQSRRMNVAQNDHDCQTRDQSQHLPAITILAAESLRSAGAPAVSEPTSSKSEERVSLFWRVFGGTLLSIAALVAITIYQQFTSSINELRNQIEKTNESRADFVKKDEFSTRMTTIWSRINEPKDNGTVTTLREKVTVQEQQLKTAEGDRKELQRELQALRERIAKLEGQQSRTIPTAQPHGD